MKDKFMRYFGIVIIIVFLFFVFTDYIISPIMHLPIVDREKPSKIYVTQYNKDDVEIAPKSLLTDDPEVIQTILSDVKYTWVTNIKPMPLDEPFIKVELANNSFGHIYSFDFHPGSDTFSFHDNLVNLSSIRSLEHLLSDVSK